MEINSPPYPKQNCSPRNLFQNLCELHDWAYGQHTWANNEAARLNAPENPYIPPLVFKPRGSDPMSRFHQLSVPDMYSSWQAMREIREQYDKIVRNYEDEADGTPTSASSIRSGLSRRPRYCCPWRFSTTRSVRPRAWI